MRLFITSLILAVSSSVFGQRSQSANKMETSDKKEVFSPSEETKEFNQIKGVSSDTLKPLNKTLNQSELKADTLKTDLEVEPVETQTYPQKHTWGKKHSTVTAQEPTKQEIELTIISLEGKIEYLKEEGATDENSEELRNKKAELDRLKIKLSTFN